MDYTKFNLNVSCVCLICGKENKSLAGLSSHLRNSHNKLLYNEYIKKYYNIDIEVLNKEWESNRKQRKLEGIKKTVANNKKIKLSPRDRLTKEQYEMWRKSMKKVFTKEWYIKKYGEDGEKKYIERAKKISENSFFRSFNKTNKNNWSKVSQELFWEIYKRINDRFKNIYFGELNHEYGCETNNNFDFVVLDNKKIIEFNGDKFHANPIFFNENDVPIKFINKKAIEIWEQDLEKNNKAINNGYAIKVVWESDFKKNKEKIILECIDFLNERENKNG